MRIVAGRHRGRSIAAPEDESVRPTSDRVRENLFNILAHGKFMGADGVSPLADAQVLDAFAGSGALGLEAASGIHNPKRSADIILSRLCTVTLQAGRLHSVGSREQGT